MRLQRQLEMTEMEYKLVDKTRVKALQVNQPGTPRSDAQCMQWEREHMLYGAMQCALLSTVSD